MAKQFSTDILAEWVDQLSFEHLPEAVIEKVEDCVLDALGCAIAGQDEPGPLAVSAMAKENYPTGPSPVWFQQWHLNAVGAAYANAAATSALDIDDGHRLPMGHPGAAVIPTALAVAEAVGADGHDVIAAIVAGYEVAIRIGHAEIKKPYHTGNWSGFGAAVTAAKLMRLDPGRIAHALAVCAYHCPRLNDLTDSAFMGADVKESIPWSVVTGISAADLAKHGFSGCRDALDLQGRFDPAVMRDGLGDGFLIMGTYFKNYSVCRWAHTSITGLADIMRAQGLSASDLQAVRVDTFAQAAALNNSPDPDNIIGAQYSLPFTMAVAAVRGEAAVSPLSADMIGAADIIRVAERIAIHHDPAMDAHLPHRAAARITVETASASHEKTVITAWGDAGGDTARDAYREKFERLAGRRLNADQTSAVVNAVGQLRSGDFISLSRAVNLGEQVAARKAG